MHPISDVHVLDTQPLRSPDLLKAELPITDAAAALVYSTRQDIRNILSNRDRRALVIVGPCSVHDPAAARDYAGRLLALRRRYEDDLLVVMRVYFEKPRTTVGWKGLINDPHLNGSHDIASGLQLARGLLLDVAHLGMPAATEMLDPIIPQYLADLVSWTAIGARTTESQTHREMASGLSMPVGFKNGTDGSISVALNAQIAASRAHSFLGIDGSGRVAIVRTTGNPDGHVVLRGGHRGPNYSASHVAQAAEELEKAGLAPRVLIDCSHDNSRKDYRRQPLVLAEVGEQVSRGSEQLLGVMIESHIEGGRQDLKTGMTRGDLTYGQSITDGCVDFATTEQMLAQFARSLRPRPVATGADIQPKR
ncbi:MAG: 3-deoxy-7-phosphoheptulonate synthase [Polyangiaceae bacterium]|jgi:3-deoxy-7-phosphoheptulonate synthase